MRKKLIELFNGNKLKLSKQFLKIGMMMIFIMLPITQSFAQQGKTINGIVSDDNNAPVPGATIVLKGTAVGAITNMDGSYSINVSSAADVLIFSFVGMVPQEVVVGDQTSINITLKTDAYGLDEVVVTGYGTQRKATLTGSITQVTGAEIMKGKGTSSAALAMQGEIPGLVVTRTSSRPGNEDLKLKIRGDISVNDIGPLIIVDGLEIPDWEFARMNSNDIETISVLKDASAAIYGTKAAGGVILVTTKRGKQGELKVTYSGAYQLNYISKQLPLMNMKEWAQFWLDVGDADVAPYVNSAGVTITPLASYRFTTAETFQGLVNGTIGVNPADTVYFNSKWHHIFYDDQLDAVYGTTMSQRHNVSISGGTEKTKVMTSIGYSNDRSIIDFVYDGTKKYNFRTNLDYKINDLMKTEFNISYESGLVDEPTTAVGYGIQDMYIFPLYNPAGQYYDIFGSNNLLAKLDEGGRTKTNENILHAGGKLIFDFNKYLKGFSVEASSHFRVRKGVKTVRTTSAYMYDWKGNPSFIIPSQANTSIKINQSDYNFQVNQLLGNYSRAFNQHNIKITAGLTSELTQVQTYEEYRANMLTDALDDLNIGDATTQTNKGGANAVGLVSYLSRVSYDYKSIYLFELVGRRDGSSRLHPDYRWKNFGSVSGGIVFSEMDFLRGKAFDLLKARVIYGSTGSVEGIGEYDYISGMSTGTAVLGSTGAYANTAWIASMTSLDRSWERVTSLNYGLDFAFLKHRLSGSLDYFVRKNNDMLVSITYPKLIGATVPKTNSGDFTTKGFDLVLKWSDKIGDIYYSVGGWLSDSRSEVTRMEGKTSISGGLNTIIEGKPLNALYIYRTDGYLQNEDEVLEYYNTYGFVEPADQTTLKSSTLLPVYRGASRLLPGCVNRVDTNDDGGITTDDLDYYGDANPHYSFGINLGISYKNFDFSARFQGVGQQYLLRTSSLAYPFRTWWTNQNSTWIGNTWTEENPNAEFPRISYDGSRKNWNYGHANDINVMNVAYVRAKNISLGYTLPTSLLNKVNIDRMRLYVSADDLFVISNVRDGLDPEKKADSAQGATVPYTSTMVFGIDITF
ncbi:MAG TPA: SusC/RagA family TonB-linked outer membrane protein [Bacteroidales bacterium]|nr:SusC/RagA family TonB-linked outer membrane protein [Bacteroidales bacterium]